MTKRIIRCCAPAALLLLTTGCAVSNPWTFNPPPTTVEPASAMRAERKTVVVVGSFADPSKAPNYARGVGRFMSESFSRALLNDGQYEVWINPQLTSAVEQIIARPAAEHASELARLHAKHQKVHFVILGKVTDFHHTADLPSLVSRRGVFGPRNEAIVAIDLRIVDMRTYRVVGADHLTGTSPARGTKSTDLYNGVALDSYLFWSTPLGRASKEAIRHAVNRTESVVPPPLFDPQIQNVLTHRRVSITGGSAAGLAVGQELFVLGQLQGLGRWEAVRDADTGRPLMVRIDSVSRFSSTGWVMGERPRDVRLRGALLTVELPPGIDVAGDSGDSRGLPLDDGDQAPQPQPAPTPRDVAGVEPGK